MNGHLQRWARPIKVSIIDNYRVKIFLIGLLVSINFWPAYVSLPKIHKLTDLATIIGPKNIDLPLQVLTLGLSIIYQTFLLLDYRIIGLSFIGPLHRKYRLSIMGLMNLTIIRLSIIGTRKTNDA
jgi:hypothetical protein